MRSATFLALAMLGLAVHAGSAQSAPATPPATPPAYIDENSKDPAPLKLDNLAGRVQGLGGDAMPRATVSLFTEDTHSLIASVLSDRDGKFHFGRLDKGLYRVVASIPGLCTANIPVKVESSLLAHRKLVITMQPKDIDTCSYGLAK